MKKSTKNLINLGLLALMFVALYFIEQAAGTRSMLVTVLKKGAIYALIRWRGAWRCTSTMRAA